MGAAENILAGLKEKPGVSPDLLALESRLLAWRESLAEEIRSAYPDPEPDPSKLAAALEDGRTLTTALNPLPETALLSKAATGFRESIEGILPLSAELSRWMTDEGSAGCREEVLALWFTASWKLDRKKLAALAESAKIQVDLLEWAGRQLARPFFHRLGELLSASRPADTETAAAAYCPSCGGAPRMGRYEREGGRRFLWCDLCNIQWPFRRLTCPFCLNQDQKKLGYLVPEGMHNYRIDVCEVCRCYLRAIDERDLPEGSRVDFLLDDVGTVSLCMTAEKEGYRQGNLDGPGCSNSSGAKAQENSD